MYYYKVFFKQQNVFDVDELDFEKPAFGKDRRRKSFENM